MDVILSFCSTVLTAHNNQDAALFSSLFRLEDDNSGVLSLRQALQLTTEEEFQKQVNIMLEDTSAALAEFVVAYLKLLIDSVSSDLVHVFDSFCAFYNALIPLFNGPDTYYQVPFVKSLSTLLVSFAFHVDRQEKLKGKAKKANRAAHLLSKIFNIMLADRAPLPDSKRLGILTVTNLAFKIYTKLDSTRLCQTFISNIKSGGIDITEYPVSQQVTYRYYLGRFQFYQSNLRKAEEHLSFAFQHCMAQQWNNKRLILKYLIPTRFILGYIPDMRLLEKYNLTYPYCLLFQRAKLGDIQGYLKVLEDHFDYFSENFSYILLRQRGVVLVWRCLIRRMSLLLLNSADDSSLSFMDCYQALTFSSGEKDLDMFDVENVLVSLISQGYIKGYLHHHQQQLVLSKSTPFPPPCTVVARQEEYNDDVMDDHLVNAQPPLPKEVIDFLEEQDEDEYYEEDEGEGYEPYDGDDYYEEEEEEVVNGDEEEEAVDEEEQFMTE